VRSRRKVLGVADALRTCKIGSMCLRKKSWASSRGRQLVGADDQVVFQGRRRTRQRPRTLLALRRSSATQNKKLLPAADRYFWSPQNEARRLTFGVEVRHLATLCALAHTCHSPASLFRCVAPKHVQMAQLSRPQFQSTQGKDKHLRAHRV
jgi:hypothetical protein